jgi:hypothetical protein
VFRPAPSEAPRILWMGDDGDKAICDTIAVWDPILKILVPFRTTRLSHHRLIQVVDQGRRPRTVLLRRCPVTLAWPSNVISSIQARLENAGDAGSALREPGPVVQSVQIAHSPRTDL